MSVGQGSYRNADGKPLNPEQVLAVRQGIESQKDVQPQLAMAVFCEQVIEGRDNLFSIIRVFDQVYLDTGTGERDFPITITMRMHFSFRALRGNIAAWFGIRQIGPNQAEQLIHSFGIGFPEGRTNADEQVVREITFPQEGQYFFDLLDERQERVTRMPLHVTAVRREPDQQVAAPPVES